MAAPRLVHALVRRQAGWKVSWSWDCHAATSANTKMEAIQTPRARLWNGGAGNQQISELRARKGDVARERMAGWKATNELAEGIENLYQTYPIVGYVDVP